MGPNVFSDVTISPGDIERAYQRIGPYLRFTPILRVTGSDFGIRTDELALKLELLQKAGSFKVRGAFANMLLREVPPAGVVAASGGNHGAAVAFAAQALGFNAKIFVPDICPRAKLDRIRAFGADLTIAGSSYDDALKASRSYATGSDAITIHAFDQHETIVGQGSIALEIEMQLPQLDTILVSVGGGGLIAGVASWFRHRAKVIGVEPSRSPTLTWALHAGHPVDAPVGGIAADSLAPKQIGERVLPIAREFVDGTVLVSDEQIRSAQHALWNVTRLAVEPGGAAAFAALHSGVYRPAAGERVLAIISGGNTNDITGGNNP